MIISYNGHASFTIESGGFSITVDPWVNSAFFGSWHPFPDNESTISSILKSDAILMSHEHEDHCDIKLLKTYQGKIYIPRYRSNSFCKKLAENNIAFTEVQPRQKHSLGPFFFEFVIQSAPAWDDAAIIISLADTTFIDLNDLKPSLADIEYIKKRYPAPAFLAYQFSGASWHPMTYVALSAAEKEEISQQKIQRKFRNSSYFIKEFNPAFVLPSAGPPCFLFDEHMKFNNGKTAIFVDLKSYHQFIEQEDIPATALYLQPGNRILFDGKNVGCDDELYSPAHIPDRQEGIIALKKKKNIQSYLKKATSDELLPYAQIIAYFGQVFINAAPFKNLLRYLVHYKIVGEKWNTHNIYVNFRKGIVSFNEYDENMQIGYKFSIPASAFNRVITGENSWEELFLSLQFDMFQHLPQHDENFFTLHKFCHTDYLQKYFMHYRNSFRNETFILEHDNEKYEVQRFCPHALADLSKGEVIDGKIICPNHGWAFCLKDGSSTTSNLGIQVKKIGSIIPA